MNYESHLFVTYLRLSEIGDQCHINISSGGSLGQVPGGVVTVDIYEVDTKIELWVDTFLLGL